MRFVTEKRLIVYPRIIFLTVYTILGLNLLFHSGWQGGGGQIIGTDFVTLYSAGLIYRQAPPDLYNFETQFEIQKAILDPTPLAGVNPFISPPYVALAYSPLTLLPLSIAFLVWLVFSLVLAYFSARILISLVPERIQNAGLNLQQFLIVILSFFPFAWGLMVGQNHALTLFLLSGLVLASLKKRMVLAGALAGLLLYKPQYVLGMLIIWLVWREYRALFSFFVVGSIWLSLSIVTSGFLPFIDYLSSNKLLLSLPYIEGFPGYLMITPYGLLATILPPSNIRFLVGFQLVIFIVFALGLVWLAVQKRQQGDEYKKTVIVLALLFPLISTPYALMHDLVILIPVIILWASFSQNRVVLYTVIFVYLGGFFLPILGLATKIALPAFIPIVLMIVLWRSSRPLTNFSFVENN